MAKRPIGTYQAGGVLLACAACGKQDAFEQRNATLWADFWESIRRVRQVVCLNCEHIHWFRR